MSIAPAATAQRLCAAVPTGLRLVLWLVVAGCAAWAVVRVLGLDRDGGAVVMLISFPPYVAAGTVAVFLTALALRAWWAAGVAGIAAAVLVACVAPRVVGGDGGAADGP